MYTHIYIYLNVFKRLHRLTITLYQISRQVVEELDALYAKGDADDFDAIQALKKKCGRVRPDMLQLAVSHLKDKHNITASLILTFLHP